MHVKISNKNTSCMCYIQEDNYKKLSRKAKQNGRTFQVITFFKKFTFFVLKHINTKQILLTCKNN